MRNASVEARGVLKLSDIFHTELFSTYIKHIKDEIIRHRNKIIKVFISELNKWSNDIQWPFTCSTLSYSDIIVCLFVFGLRLTREIFTRQHYRWRTTILTYTRHSWSFSIEGFFSCHIYCDTAHLFIMVISEDPWHSNLLPSVWQWSCHYMFKRLRSSVASGIRAPYLPHARRTI